MRPCALIQNFVRPMHGAARIHPIFIPVRKNKGKFVPISPKRLGFVGPRTRAGAFGPRRVRPIERYEAIHAVYRVVTKKGFENPGRNVRRFRATRLLSDRRPSSDRARHPKDRWDLRPRVPVLDRPFDRPSRREWFVRVRSEHFHPNNSTCSCAKKPDLWCPPSDKSDRPI